MKKELVSGIKWNVLSQTFVQVFNLVILYSLLRLVTPEEFGIVAMITAIVGFLRMLINFGLTSAFIQDKDLNQTKLSTGFWITTFVSVGFFLLMLASSSIIQAFYNISGYNLLIVFLSSSLIFFGVTLIPEAILSKGLKFRQLELRRIIASCLSGIIAITIALLGYGYWAVAFQIVVNFAVSCILIWSFVHWRPSFEFSLSSLKRLKFFSFSIFISSLLQYISDNIDNLLIGKRFGGHQLGLYSKSFSTLAIPSQNLNLIINRTLFPVLSSFKYNIENIKIAYLQILKAITFLVIPLMSSVFIFSSEFVYIFFGEKWGDIVPLVKIFCVIGVLNTIENPSGNIFLTFKKSNTILKLAFYKRTAIVALILIGLNWGIIGVAFGRLFAALITITMSFQYVKKEAKILFKEQLSTIIIPVVTGALVFGNLYLIKENIFFQFTSSSFLLTYSSGLLLYFYLNGGSRMLKYLFKGI